MKRAKFSEITAVSMQRAMQTLAEPDVLTSNAVDVRGELDLRIGLEFFLMVYFLQVVVQQIYIVHALACDELSPGC